MKKQKRLLTSNRYEIFEDVNDRNVIYGMSSVFFDENRARIMGGIVGDRTYDPDQTVEVYLIQKVGEMDQYTDEYDVVGDAFEIPLSRLETVFVKVVPEVK